MFRNILFLFLILFGQNLALADLDDEDQARPAKRSTQPTPDPKKAEPDLGNVPLGGPKNPDEKYETPSPKPTGKPSKSKPAANPSQDKGKNKMQRPRQG